MTLRILVRFGSRVVIAQEQVDSEGDVVAPEAAGGILWMIGGIERALTNQNVARR